MGKIIGIKPGLLPVVEEDEEPEPVKVKPREVIEIPLCECCRGQMTKSERATTHPRALEDSPMCLYCINFFGGDVMGGVTNVDHETALRKWTEIREQGYLMCLIHRTFGGKGAHYEVEKADVYRPNRVGSDRLKVTEKCCKERTWEIFTCSIVMAREEITLFPHEVAAIPFHVVMELKKLGELEESFVSSNDETGHFTPTKKIKKQIARAFG